MLKLIQTLQGVSLAFVLGMAVTVATLFTGLQAPRLYVDILKSRMTSEELDALSEVWSEHIQISQSGEIMIRRNHFNPRKPEDRTSELFDLERNPIKEPLASELNERPLPWSSVSHPGLPQLFHSDPIPLVSRVTQLAWDREETEAWYYVYGGPQRGQGYGWFEGYNRRTRKLLGYLGMSGLSDKKPHAAECFQIPAMKLTRYLLRWDRVVTFESFSGYRDRLKDQRGDVALDAKTPIEESQLLILSKGRVWTVDLKERTVRPFSSDANVQSVSVARRLDFLPDDYQPNKLEEADDTMILREFVALRFDDHIKLTNREEGEAFEIPIPDEIRDSYVDFFCLLPDGSMVAKGQVEYREHTAGADQERDHKIVRVNRDGTQESWSTTTKGKYGRGLISSRAAWWMTVWMVPAPLVSSLTTTFGHAVVAEYDPELTIYDVMLERLEKAWPALLTLSLFSAVLVWLADRRLANHRLPRSKVWLTFVFMFGLPGYIGFLLHRKWPAKNPVPGPQRSGIEVFA